MELTRGTGCRVLAGFLGVLGRQLDSIANCPVTWATAALARDRGVDGFGLGMDGWVPNGWPWTKGEYRMLRLLGHPELLANANRVYRVRSGARGVSDPEPLFPLDGPRLPLPLAAGSPLELPFSVADDLPRWHSQARVKSVRIRVHVAKFDIAGRDSVEVSLNGRSLPDSIRRGIDLHFRYLKNQAVGPYGYFLQYRLSPEHFAVKRKNAVAPGLLRRNPRIRARVKVDDVDCTIEYRHHWHYQKAPIEY